MRIMLDIKTKNKKGKYILLEVDNVSFGTGEICFIFGDNNSGTILYSVNIPDNETEVYDILYILSLKALEKGFLDLRGYEYHMYDEVTGEELIENY